MHARAAGAVLLMLPCNGCVRLGDYSLRPNWHTKLYLARGRRLGVGAGRF